MTEEQAYKQGLLPTEMVWPLECVRIQKVYEERVNTIKEKYNCKVVLVTDEDGWLRYFGDKNFMLALDVTTRDYQKIINSCEDRLEKAKLEYEEKVEKINAVISRYETKLAMAKSIEK